MITPEKIQQIKTAYSFLKPSPIFDLVEAFEELQEKVQSQELALQDLAKTNYELGGKIEDDFKPYIKKLEDENNRLKKNHSICGVCFTSSWQPCPSETPSAFPDQKTGGWMVCGYCSLAAALEDCKKSMLNTYGNLTVAQLIAEIEVLSFNVKAHEELQENYKRSEFENKNLQLALENLVKAHEELQAENQELKTICEAMVSTITDGWLDFAGPEGTINLPIKVSEFKRLKTVLEKQEKQ